MKRGILFAVLITFHVLWIGTMSLVDAAGTARINLPNEVIVSSLFLFAWVGYQAVSWAQSGIKEKIK
ncbi:hypothetical protein [Bdellovibrio sp. HCB209]|uniref:hypothetical protein n=1 Tax=Bdellovibrio sp. HCB209 TaxID=3394354 RepID=UPI0039B3864E